MSCLRWYNYRWLIERYHYVLKIGCRLEQLQLETADRIHRANLQNVIFVLLKRLANHILVGEDSNNSTHSFDRHQEYSKLMKIQQYKFPLVVILAGILFSLYLQWQIPDGVFFSGDAGLKALLAQQFSAGNFRFDLDVPADQWVRDLWKNGLYPFDEPFVYNRYNRYYITFPFTFPLVSAPFHALFGYRGFYIIPLISLWAIWLSFYLACQRLKLKSVSTSIALATLIFASPLSIYSATYWEHTLAVALNFHGISTLLIPGSQGLSKKDAALSGILIGLSVWFREEILGMVAFLCILVYAASLLMIRKLEFLAKRKEIFVFSMIATIAGFFVLNTLIYHHPLGMHSVQIVEKFSFSDRLNQGLDNFKQMGLDLFYYFPITFFTILYLPFSIVIKKKIKLTIQMKIFYLICFLFIVAVALMVPPGAGGKQWGPRFLLVLIPLISLIGIIELKFIRRIAKWGLRYIGLAIFFVLFLIGVYINTYQSTDFISDNYQRISPAIQFLRSQPDTVVAMSHQYVAQVLEAGVKNKVFFKAENAQDLKSLGAALIGQGKQKFLYMCYPYRPCEIPEEKPEDLKFSLKNQTFTIKLSSLGKFGIYPTYDALLVKG